MTSVASDRFLADTLEGILGIELPSRTSTEQLGSSSGGGQLVPRSTSRPSSGSSGASHAPTNRRPRTPTHRRRATDPHDDLELHSCLETILISPLIPWCPTSPWFHGCLHGQPSRSPCGPARPEGVLPRAPHGNPPWPLVVSTSRDTTTPLSLQTVTMFCQILRRHSVVPGTSQSQHHRAHISTYSRTRGFPTQNTEVAQAKALEIHADLVEEFVAVGIRGKR